MDNIIEEIILAGRFLDQKGLCPATSGNISRRIDHEKIAITATGKHKGLLESQDILVVDRKGRVLAGHQKPSAETLLHTSLYNENVAAVLHTHSLNGTALSLRTKKPFFQTKGYEIHKAFPGIDTHESELVLPIFENNQNIESLAFEVSHFLQKNPFTFGYFLRGHGLYTWGKTMHEAKMRVEAFEFLFACELIRLTKHD